MEMRVVSLLSVGVFLVAGDYVNTPLTTDLWALCAKSDLTKTEEALEAFLYKNPEVATARSEDHRGGMWWAYEYKNAHAIAALSAHAAPGEGVPHPHTEEEDEDGNLPRQMCTGDGCDELTAELVANLESAKRIILAKKAKFEEAETKELDDADDDEDDLDDHMAAAAVGSLPGSGSKPAAQEDGSLDVDVDEDEDM